MASTDTTEATGEVLTADEAADLLRINRNTLYELVKAGEVPALRLGRSLRFHRDVLERMLREGSAPPHDAA